MKFAICNELFQDWPLDKGFQFARQCGYTGVELAPFTLGADAHAIDASARNHIRELAEQAGLEVIGLHWLLAKTQGYYLTSPDSAIRQRTADYLVELARLCRDVGGTIMVLGSPQQRNLLPGVTPDEGMDYAEEVLRTAAPQLESLDVTLALEPLGPEEGNFLLTARSAIELADRVGSPNVRLHLDVKAMSSEATPIPVIIRQSAGHLVHFHANDPNRRGPGMGEVDFRPIFQALADVGYGGWVSVEVFDYSPGIERLARESIEYMQRCVREIQA